MVINILTQSGKSIIRKFWYNVKEYSVPFVVLDQQISIVMPSMSRTGLILLQKMQAMN